MSTTTPKPPVTRPEHMFEPDGFPTRILFVMLGALTVALVVTVLALMAYFESAAQAELAVKAQGANPELIALREAEQRELRGYGFSSCPDRPPPAEGEPPAADVLCTPQEAKYYVPYDDTLLDAFLEAGQGALQPGPTPPGTEPLPTAEPGALRQVPRQVPPMQRDGGARPERPQRRPGAVPPAGTRIEQRPRPPAGTRPMVVPGQRGGTNPGSGGTPPGAVDPHAGHNH